MTTPVRVVCAVAVAVSAAGCSSGGPAVTGSSSRSPLRAGTPVQVAETEFSIGLPTKTLSAGTYTFHISNKGAVSHNLTVSGPGVDAASSPIISAGQSGQLTVTLMKGSYEFWCSVDSHKDRGMDLKLVVG